MQAHSHTIRALRPDADMEPLPGFYARVLERIEQTRPSSFWNVLVESAFGPRLALASAVLAVLMGIALVTQPVSRPAPMQIDPASLTVVAGGREDVPAPVLGASDEGGQDQDQVRNAVFVSLATYRD